MRLTANTVKALKPREAPFEVNDEDLAGFLLRVQPSGYKCFYCRYRTADGKQRRVKIGSAAAVKPDEARAHAQKMLSTVHLGGDPARVKAEQKAHTLRSFVDDVYLPHIREHQTTWRNSLRMLNKDFADLMNLKLVDITSWEVEKWSAAKLKAGAKASSVLRTLKPLLSAMHCAVEWKFLPAYTLTGVTKPLSKRLDRNKRPRFLSPNEAARLYAALDARERALPEPDCVKPVILLALNTGMRRGELLSLVWENIRFDQRVLLVPGDSSKNSQSRDIPLNDAAVRILKNWQTTTGASSGLVFPSPRGGKLWSVDPAWYAVRDAAKIKGFVFHNLRSTFASWLAIQGVSLQIIGQLLGHQTAAMTAIYAGLSDQVKSDAVAKLDGREVVNLDAEREKREANK